MKLIFLAILGGLPLAKATTVYQVSNQSALSAALNSVSDGDTVELTTNITLNETMTIDDNITLQSSTGNKFFLDGGGSVRILYINSGKTVEINSITFQNVRPCLIIDDPKNVLSIFCMNLTLPFRFYFMILSSLLSICTHILHVKPRITHHTPGLGSSFIIRPPRFTFLTYTIIPPLLGSSQGVS